MAIVKTYIPWVLWACMGILWAVEGTHRRSHSSYGNPRNTKVLAPPSDVMVEALRQLLNLPSYDVRGGFSPSAPQPRPPRYMLNLYRKISQGDSSLPRHANTVRSFKPRTAVGTDEDLLLFNLSALATEQVLGAWLHLRGSSGRERLASRLRPTRVLVYLLPEGVTTSSTSSSSGKDSVGPPLPIMTHSLSPHQQEIRLTRGVREVTEKAGNGRASNGQLGIRVEELRRGRYVPRSPEKLTRRPPLLFVYSSDPTLLDLTALGASALNVSKDLYKHSYGKSYAQSAHLRRYTREAGHEMQPKKEAIQKTKRSIGEDDWNSLETEEVSHNIEGPSENLVERRPNLTNKLPFGNHSEDSPFLPKSIPTEEERESALRRHRRRRKKNHRRRKDDEEDEDDDNPIPLPENYSKTKWGERESRRGNRKLPDIWLAAAQNTVSNYTNSLNYPTGSPGGGPMSTRPCDRHKMEVNFKALGWDHLIIAPAGFDAFYCAGECLNPLTKEMSGNIHAILQSMIYSMGLRPNIPAPCCVPEKLGSITLLSMDGEDRFVLKTYPRMVVTSCSCQ